MKVASIGRTIMAAISCIVLTNLSRAARAGEPPANIRTIVGITQPSEQRKLVFPAQGIVKQVFVKEGDEVKKGQLLVKLDDESDLLELARLEIDATSQARIEAAQADLKAKTLTYTRKKDAYDKNAAGRSEVDEAEADMITRQKQLKVAQDEFAQAKLKRDQQRVRCDRMQLKSTVNGSVQKVFIGEGEFNDPQRQDGAVFVVQNDPLKIEIRELKTRQVATLRRGDKLEVRYVNDAPDAWQPAEVTFIAPMADAPSDKQMVQLSLPNPNNRSSGLHMEVKLTPKLIETAPSDETALITP